MFKIADILNDFSITQFKGNKNAIIKSMVSLDSEMVSDNPLSWCSNSNIEILKGVQIGSYILSSDFADEKWLNKNVNYFFSNQPRELFALFLMKYFKKKKVHSISQRALIHKSAFKDENVEIGDNVILESDCVIVKNSSIGSNSVILSNSIIGDNVSIGANCTIGGVGFGYEKDEIGKYFQIPHIGNVVIKNFVEIGINTCIDRAVLGSTLIEENVKIDNLVHIAHGVKVGRNSLLIAHSMIAGSAIFGENVWVAPNASIMNKVKIGNNAVIGLGAVVLKDLQDSMIIVGNPGKIINKSISQFQNCL